MWFHQGAHPAEIIDAYQQRFEYYQGMNSYLHTGSVTEQGDVDFIQDGLVTPVIYHLLSQISLCQSTGGLSGVKLLDNPNAYWYHLNPSRNISVQPTPEAIDIDININHLVNSYRMACRGKKGKQGQVGDHGLSGIRGPREAAFIPTIKDDRLSVVARVLTPLETPISIRLQRDNKQRLEIHYYLTGNWRIVSGDLRPSKISITYDRSASLLEFRATGPWIGRWDVLVRQIGPTGDKGPDGTTFLELDNTVTDVISYTAMVSLYVGGGDLIYGRKSFEDSASFHVSGLRPYGSAAITTTNILMPIGQAFPDYWASISPSPDKTIFRWGMVSDDRAIEINVGIPDWTPLKVIGYGGWTGFEEAEDIPCCREDLFICHTPIPFLECSSASSLSSESWSSFSSESLSSASELSWSSDTIASISSEYVPSSIETVDECSSCSSVSSSESGLSSISSLSMNSLLSSLSSLSSLPTHESSATSLDLQSLVSSMSSMESSMSTVFDISSGSSHIISDSFHSSSDSSEIDDLSSHSSSSRSSQSESSQSKSSQSKSSDSSHSSSESSDLDLSSDSSHSSSESSQSKSSQSESSQSKSSDSSHSSSESSQSESSQSKSSDSSHSSSESSQSESSQSKSSDSSHSSSESSQSESSSESSDLDLSSDSSDSSDSLSSLSSDESPSSDTSESQSSFSSDGSSFSSDGSSFSSDESQSSFSSDGSSLSSKDLSSGSTYELTSSEYMMSSN